MKTKSEVKEQCQAIEKARKYDRGQGPSSGVGWSILGSECARKCSDRAAMVKDKKATESDGCREDALGNTTPQNAKRKRDAVHQNAKEVTRPYQKPQWCRYRETSGGV